jgi:alginate O-acetyltransferase complex protein AlgI
MDFCGLAFICLFVPITVGGYFLLNRYPLESVQDSKLWLIAASLIFYAGWSLLCVPVVLFSAAVNYALSKQLLASREKDTDQYRRQWLVYGIIFNIGLFAYFRDGNFVIRDINFLSYAHLATNIIFPIGIGYFSLQQIAFLMDTYEGITEEKAFLNYLLFVIFFPYLKAGPLTHHRQVIPQLDEPKNAVANFDNISRGFFLFSIGMFKEAVIGGDLKILMSGAHNHSTLSFVDAWYDSLFCTLWLYFDFSGYSDMAVGLGRLFNVMLPINFNSPFKATNMVEFWRRWHITLSSFMRTYVFTAILRSRDKITFRFSLGVSFLTMMLIGLWHGPTWNCLLVGVILGLAMVIFSVWMKLRITLPKIVGWFLVFNVINLAVIPMQISTLDAPVETTIGMMKGMLGLNGLTLPPDLKALLPGLAKTVTFGPLYFGATSFQLVQNTMFLVCVMAVVGLARNSMEMVELFRPNLQYFGLLLFLFITPVLRITHVNNIHLFQIVTYISRLV